MDRRRASLSQECYGCRERIWEMAPNQKREQRRCTGPALLAASAVAIIAGAGWLWFIWIPNRRLGDITFVDQAAPGEVRRIAERVLQNPWGNHHDACLLLSRVGDAGSIPVPVRSLRGHAPPVDNVADCTVLHCVEALRQLTGQDAGMDPRQWEVWWSTVGSKLPPSAFPRTRADRAGAQLP
jgi:hypothetical protein